MTAIFGIGSSVKYQELEEKISKLDSKLTHVFNRTASLLYSLSIVSSVLIVGYVSLAILATASIALSGTPVHATILKCALIFGVSYGVFILGTVALIGMKSKSVIKNNPV